MDYWQRVRQAVGKETLIIPGGLQEIGESIQQTAESKLCIDCHMTWL